MPNQALTSTVYALEVPFPRGVRLLGFQKHDIPVLVTAKLLSPLGTASNAPKYFASVDVQDYAPSWNRILLGLSKWLA